MTSYVVTSFSTGEISRKFAGRIELPQYKTGCKTMQNIFPLQTGGAEKRPGTVYGGTAPAKCILIPWIKSETEYLFLELSAAKIRFYSYSSTTQKASLIYDGASPYEVSLSGASWISEADLYKVKWVQDSVATIYDTMYFSCPGYTLRKLVRTSDTLWTFSAASLTAYGGTNAETCETFEDRLILTESTAAGKLYGSKTASHLDFGVSSPVVATDGFSFTVSAKDNTKILWTAASDALLFGTASNVYKVAGKNDVLDGTTLAIWPVKQSAIGASDIQPVLYNEYLVFVQKGKKRVHMVVYSQEADLYQANELTFFSSHITGSGLLQLAFQRDPDPILWAVNADGELLSMMYSQMTQSVGWSRHDVGGTVESICVIQTDNEDALCISVLREIDGEEVRYIETLSRRSFDNIEDAHFVDSGVIINSGDAVDVTTISPSLYAIGDDGPAGGHIFHIDGDTVYEAAPVSTEWTVQYQSSTNQICASMGATPNETAIGKGTTNTDTLVTWLTAQGQSGKAAQLCAALSEGGETDWFLPSRNELQAMYTNLKAEGIGGFSDVRYWSSSESITTYRDGPGGIIYYWGGAEYIDFTAGATSYIKASYAYRVRAARSFTQPGLTPLVTATAHGFSNDQKIKFVGVSGVDIEDNIYTVKSASTDTFELYTEDGTAPASMPAWGTGGTAMIVIGAGAVSGLSHLEGEEVQILGDGSVIANQTVVDGGITLTEAANKLHIGLPYTAILEPNNIAINNYKLKRIVEVFAKFYKTVTVKVGKDVDNLITIQLQEGSPTMGEPPELITDASMMTFENDFSSNPTFVIVSDAPLPMTVLNIVAEVET